MTTADRAQLVEVLLGRRDAVAEAWYRAISRTSFVPLRSGDMRQRLGALTEQAVRVLLDEPFDRAEAEAIGAALVQLHCIQPEALGETQRVLAEHLLGGLPAEQIAALHPRLASVLGRVAAGFYAAARGRILEEQEAVRSALLAARQQAEAALWASEARFRAIFDAAALGIVVTDMAGVVQATNSAVQTMLGYSADELSRMSVTDFTHPDDRALDWELYRDLVAGQRDHFTVEKQFYAKSGRLVWCHLTASLVRDADGRPLFAIAMMDDVTDRKRAEETVSQLNAELERRVADRTAQLAAANQELTDQVARRSRAEAERGRLLREEQTARTEVEAARRRLAFLAEASRVLASSLDYETTLHRVAHLAVPTLADWCIVDVAEEDGSINRLAVAHADPSKGAWAEELLGRFPPRQDARHGASMALRTGQPELIADASGRLELLLPSTSDTGAPQHLEVLRHIAPKAFMVVPLMARGRTTGAITFVAAESERRYGPAELALAEDLASRAGTAVDNARLYQEAQEAVAARQDFLSVAAHELKTPITGIVTSTDLALRQVDRPAGPDLDRLRQVLQVLDRQTSKFADLVAQLLDISRIEAGRLVLAREPTDLARLVEDVAARKRLEVDQRTITVHSPPSVPAVVDPVRVEQVLTNLLSNAVKYSPGGGPIDVEVSTPEPDAVSIAVRDRGIGIPVEHRARLFDRFYRIRPADRVAGMGLGLFISRQIAEAHGGRIEAEFPPDGGTRFVITLPTGVQSSEEGQGA
jgi:PAS domain S-box-containing protein